MVHELSSAAPLGRIAARDKITRESRPTSEIATAIILAAAIVIAGAAFAVFRRAHDSRDSRGAAAHAGVGPAALAQ
jgi:hypothetical protein